MHKKDDERPDYAVTFSANMARDYGVPVAILVYNVRYFTAVNKADGKGEYYHSMKAIAEASGLSYCQIKAAAKKAKEAGLIDYHTGYKPGTTEKTTYWKAIKRLSESTKIDHSDGTKIDHSSYINNKDINNKEIGKAEKANSNPELEKVYQHYLDRFGTTAKRYKLTEKRRAKLKSRLADCGAEMICEAIDHAKEDYWYSGDNQRGWKADLDFIIRSYENVEKLANLQPRQRQLTWQERKDAEEQAEVDRKFSTTKPVYEDFVLPEGYEVYGAKSDPDAPTREPFSDEFIEEMRQRALGGKRRKEQNNDN